MAAAKMADLVLVLGSFEHASMFTATLPHAVDCEPAARHAFQDKYLAMAAEDLRSRCYAAEQEVAVAVAKSDEGDALVTTLQQHLEPCKSAAEAAIACSHAKRDALGALHKEAKKAAAQHHQSDAVLQKAIKSQGTKRQEHDRVAFIRDGPLHMLWTGGWEDGEAQEDAIKTVTEFLVSIDAEQALVAALPGVYSLKPEVRRYFDKLIEENVTRIVSSRLDTLDKEAEESVRETDQVAAETLGLWAIMEEASDAVKAAELDKLTAEEAVEKASADHMQASTDLAQHKVDTYALSKKTNLLKTAVQQLKDAHEAVERLRVGGYATEATEAQQVEMITETLPMAVC